MNYFQLFSLFSLKKDKMKIISKAFSSLNKTILTLFDTDLFAL